MEEKKGRGLGKGLSELLGEARAKATMAKQAKSDIEKQTTAQATDLASDLKNKLEQSAVTPQNQSHKENQNPDFDDDNFETVTQEHLESFELNHPEKKLEMQKNIHQPSSPEAEARDRTDKNITVPSYKDDIVIDTINDTVKEETIKKSIEPREQLPENLSENLSIEPEFKEQASLETETKAQKEPEQKIEDLQQEAVDDELNALIKDDLSFLKKKIFSKNIDTSNKPTNTAQVEPTNMSKAIAENIDVQKEGSDIENNHDYNIQLEKIKHDVEISETKKAVSSEDTSSKKSAIDNPYSPNDRTIHHLPIELVNPNPDQPRKYFDTYLLNELAESIKEYGVIQPILVNQQGDEYIIIGGERRWRASQIAEQKTIPAIIKNYNDSDTLEVALIENLQRTDLTPIEEARCYQYLIQKYELTQSELSKKLGKSRSHIANMVRLLDLDHVMQECLDHGDISVGHARALIGVKNAPDWAMRIVKEHLSVRKLEELLNQTVKSSNSRLPNGMKSGKDSDILALEADLKAALGVPVSIKTLSSQRGSLMIRYDNLEQLDEICRRLCSNWGN